MKPDGSVGVSIPRVDAVEKATGEAVFTTDLTFPGMLYAKVLRSPYPHARVVSMDLSEALKIPGVKAAANWENTSACMYNSSCSEANPPAVPVEDEQIFNRELRYVGDEVAAVAAVSEEIAEEAIKRIKVEYEELPAVFDPLEAMKPEAPAVHPCFLGNNIAGMAKLPMGDVEQGFTESDIVIEEQFKLPVVKHCQLETQSAVASFTTGGGLTVWSTTQSPHPLRGLLAKLFSIPASRVRVLNPPYIGGAFGSHVGTSAKAEPIAAALSIMAKKPVKLVYDRKEDFTASPTRHSGYVTVKLGSSKDGILKSLYLKAVLNTGAYACAGPDVTAVLGVTNVSIYKIPNVMYDGLCVYTNTTTAGAMRGFGNPQGNFAVESAMDILAKKLGLDPVELRLKNVMTPYAPWLPPYPCATAGLAECIEKGASQIDWEHRDRVKTAEKPFKLRGVGMAAGTHVSNSWPFAVEYDNAYLALQEDGSAQLAVGVPDMGQGIATTLTQVAASSLGLKAEQVHTVFGDTQSTPYDIGSHASRTLYSAGTAVNAAGKDAREKLFDFLAGNLNTAKESLDMKDGVITVDGAEKMTIKEAAHLLHRNNKQLVGIGQTVPFNAPPWHAHFAEVEVDVRTGQVTVLRVVAAHDVGRAINPDIVEGQIQGSILQGIGYALSEQILYDSHGKQVQDSFHKYYLPTIMEAPEIETILVETNEPSGPFGAKGVGECGLVPTAAAIASAVEHAIGVRLHEIPMTEEKVLEAIKSKSTHPGTP